MHMSTEVVCAPRDHILGKLCFLLLVTAAGLLISCVYTCNIIVISTVILSNALSGPDPLRTPLGLTVSEACSIGDPISYADDV
jgi:hypothetical protein